MIDLFIEFRMELFIEVFIELSMWGAVAETEQTLFRCPVRPAKSKRNNQHRYHYIENVPKRIQEGRALEFASCMANT